MSANERRHRTTSLLASASLVACAVLYAAPALPASLSAAISSARSEGTRLAGRSWNFEAERKYVESLDRIADDFHDQAASGEQLTSTSYKLIEVMENARKRYADVLEEIQAEIIRIDGDLEAAQDSDRWQQHELLAMRVLYRLNWIRYETAMRFETVTSKRKTLLERAARGFEEFMGSANASLTVEVLLGHGLSKKALRDYDTAIKDFSAALEIAEEPAMISRLRIGLVEVYLSTNRDREALEETGRLLAAKPKGDAAAQALFLRSKALLLALERQPSGTTRSNHVKECARHLEQLYENGDYWRAKVVQLVDAGTVSPDEWAAMARSEFISWLVADSLRRRDQCDRAVPLYSGLLESERFRSESLYGGGFCAFHSGRYDEALEKLGMYLTENDDGAHAVQASYLRFKSAESRYIAADTDVREEAGAEYIRLLQAFLDRAPNHEQAYEAWFRLGDWHREHNEYIDCATAFAKVAADNLLSLKASYLSAQCYVEAVLAVPEENEPPADLVRTAIGSLDLFLSAARGPDGAPPSAVTKTLEARATVMAASIVTKSGVGDMQERLDRLAQFEQDYGEDSELFPEVLSLRIVAYRSLSDLDAAGAQLERLMTLEGAEAYRRDSLKKLGIVFLKEAAERAERGDAEGAMRSRRVALRVYERLLDDAQTESPEAAEPLDGLRNLIADLRAQVDAAPPP